MMTLMMLCLDLIFHFQQIKKTEKPQPLQVEGAIRYFFLRV